MPRRLLRDGRIVDDDWSYLGEAADSAPAALILTFRAMADRARRVDCARRPAGRRSAAGPQGGSAGARHRAICPDCRGVSRAQRRARLFPGARCCANNGNSRGELRATGYVRRDQLFFMARCGFNSFELPDADIEAAARRCRPFRGPISRRTTRDCRSSCGTAWRDTPANA